MRTPTTTLTNLETIFATAFARQNFGRDTLRDVHESERQEKVATSMRSRQLLCADEKREPPMKTREREREREREERERVVRSDDALVTSAVPPMKRRVPSR